MKQISIMIIKKWKGSMIPISWFSYSDQNKAILQIFDSWNLLTCRGPENQSRETQFLTTQIIKKAGKQTNWVYNYGWFLFILFIDPNEVSKLSEDNCGPPPLGLNKVKHTTSLPHSCQKCCLLLYEFYFLYYEI